MYEELEKYSDVELKRFMSKRNTEKKILKAQKRIEVLRRVSSTILEEYYDGNKVEAGCGEIYREVSRALDYEIKRYGNLKDKMEKAAAYRGQENETSN
jgi:hypothetical protein